MKEGVLFVYILQSAGFLHTWKGCIIVLFTYIAELRLESCNTYSDS